MRIFYNHPCNFSDEELGNLLASENEELTTSEESNDLTEAIDWDSPPTSETSLEDELSKKTKPMFRRSCLCLELE